MSWTRLPRRSWIIDREKKKSKKNKVVYFCVRLFSHLNPHALWGSAAQTVVILWAQWTTTHPEPQWHTSHMDLAPTLIFSPAAVHWGHTGGLAVVPLASHDNQINICWYVTFLHFIVLYYEYSLKLTSPSEGGGDLTTRRQRIYNRCKSWKSNQEKTNVCFICSVPNQTCGCESPLNTECGELQQKGKLIPDVK